MNKRIRLHVRVVRSASALWRDPNDVLGRVLDVAGLAVDAVLRVDLETVGAVIVVDEFVHARRTVAAFRACVFREVQGDGDGRVLENQVAGLVLLVIGIGDEYRGEAIEREFSVGLRIVDGLALRGGPEAFVVGVAVVQRPGKFSAEQGLLDSDHHGPGVESLGHPLLEVARAVQLVEEPRFLERRAVSVELVCGSSRPQCDKRGFRCEHAGLDRRVAAFYSRGVEESCFVADKAPARKRELGQRYQTAGGDRARAVGDALATFEEDADVRMGLVALEFLVRIEEFQRYKTHPNVRIFFEGGKRIAYGARAIAAGGLISLPKLTFPGGCLVGDEAGFLNASRIKGSHAAIKSGMLAAEAAFVALRAGRSADELDAYSATFQESWLFDELYRARNFKQWMSKGLYSGTVMVGVEQTLLGGKFPWTLHHGHADHECLRPASECEPIDYPKADGKLTFDRLSSVFVSNTNHEENQPCHLILKDATVPVALNLAKYAGPENRYCPAVVYEFVKNNDGTDRLQINAQNCVHCKTCDIKDPTQNIVWVTPQGGGGPNYPNM